MSMELRDRPGGGAGSASNKDKTKTRSVSVVEESDFESFVRQSLKSILSGQDSMRASIKELKTKQVELENSIEFQAARTSVVERKVTPLTKRMSSCEADIKHLQDVNNKLERHSRKCNLILCNYGPEKKDEIPSGIVNSVLKDHLDIDTKVEIAHRLGKKKDGSTRPIIFKVGSVEDRDRIIRAKRKLQAAKVPFYIKQDETLADRKVKQQLKNVASEAYNSGKKTLFRNGKLFIDGVEFKPPNDPIADASASSSKENL